MARPSRYPTELRERAVRMVMESRRDYPHESAVIRSVAAKLGITSTESLRKWLRQAEIDISVERAKLARERSEIEAKLRSVEDSSNDHSSGKSNPKQAGRWLTRLGLKDDDK